VEIDCLTYSIHVQVGYKIFCIGYIDNIKVAEEIISWGIGRLRYERLIAGRN
jgi:hypothetical protein